jgi:hypothetical protein
LWHDAGNPFRDRGVRAGGLFPVSCFGGRVSLLGRLDVACPLGPVEAAVHAGGDLRHFGWARDHAFASDDNTGPMPVDLVACQSTPAGSRTSHQPSPGSDDGGQVRLRLAHRRPCGRPDISRANFTFPLLALDWGWTLEETAARRMRESPRAQENGAANAPRTARPAAAAVARRAGPQR